MSDFDFLGVLGAVGADNLFPTPEPVNTLATVYRLEKDGLGPCRHPEHGVHHINSSPFKSPMDRLDWSYLEPAGWYDAIFQWLKDMGRAPCFISNTDLRFGCTTEAGLLDYWGIGMIAIAQNKGFDIVEYQVPKNLMCMATNNLQCAFILQKQELQKAA